MKKEKTWSLFEILFLIFSILVVSGCFLFSGDKNYFSLSCSILGIIAVLAVSKGLVWAPYINLVFNTCYAILSFTQGFYGEFIISIVFMNAIYIMSIISWLKNRGKQNKEIVEVNKITKKEYLFLFVAIIILTIVFYFVLKALNTQELIISTLSLTGSGVAAYLMFRRCSYYALGYIFNDLVLITLWTINVVKNGLGYLPTVISFVVFLINDTYGLIHWKKEEKKQSLQTSITVETKSN